MPNKRFEIELAAQRLFALNGFRATSIRDIAKAANVNSSMISYYFRSKEQLLSGIFKRQGTDSCKLKCIRTNH